MKIWKTFAYSCAIAGCIALMSACNKDYTGKENSHPLFAKSLACKTSHNYAKAAEAMEGFLAVCPKSGRAHKELADLYGDYINDYLKAIYHYEKYLEYANPAAQDRQDIRKLIESNKRKYYEKYCAENGIACMEPGQALEVKSLPEDQERIRFLETANNSLKEMQAKMAAKYAALSEEVKRLRGDLKNKQITPRSSASGKKTAASHSASAAPAVTGAKTTYVVKRGDTLGKISAKVYGSSKYWRVILDANKSTVGSKGAVKIGQKLVIPKLAKK